MTKPHTTLSEAVRALALPEPAGTLQYVRPLGRPGYLKAYTADQVRALLESVAKLVEQHEAQEPVGYEYRAISNHLPDTAKNDWVRCTKAAYESYKENPISNNVRWQVRELYAQPTLAATQAGDAWISVQDRLPSDGGVVMAWNGDSIVFERWRDRHESPVEWSSVTVPIGQAWDEHEFEEITHWMPLPPAPTTDKKG